MQILMMTMMFSSVNYYCGRVGMNTADCNSKKNIRTNFTEMNHLLFFGRDFFVLTITTDARLCMELNVSINEPINYSHFRFTISRQLKKKIYRNIENNKIIRNDCMMSHILLIADDY